MTRPARFLIEVQIEPLPGYNVLTCGGDQYMVINMNDTTNNVMLDTDIVASVLEDQTRHPLGTFAHGHGEMWRFKSVASPPGDWEE